MADRSWNVMCFDTRGSIVLRTCAFLLILCAGLLISNSDYNVLGLPLGEAS